MKKISSIFVACVLFFSLLQPAYAHPGRLDAKGGHTCHTNCAKYGLKNGEYHYHRNGKIVHVNSGSAKPKTSTKTSHIGKRVTAKIVKVVDGDTVKVYLNHRNESVRLIGVDTPETVHPNKPVQYYGKQASNFTKRSLTNKTVTLEFDVQQRDRYGRLLAYVWVGKTMFNQTLVKEGYARVMTIQPNVKYQNTFLKLERQARQLKKGLWK